MDCREPRTAHTSGPARGLHSGKGQGQRGDRGCKHRSFASLYRVVIQTGNPQRKREIMSTNNTYLAVFLGSKTGPRRAAWDALSETDRRAKEQEGMAAWMAWVNKHQAAIVTMGGPLGKTKKISQQGIEDASNHLGAFTIVRAESHEAAAKMFEKHPHFSIFPGDSVEVMP